jgi:hypothetical protein
VRPSVAQQVRLLGRRQQPVHADEERAEPLRGEEQDRQVHVVREADRDARAARDTEPCERVGGAIRSRVERSEGEAPAAPDERLAPGIRRDDRVDHPGRRLRPAARQRQAQRRGDQTEVSRRIRHGASVASTTSGPAFRCGGGSMRGGRLS